MEEFSCPLCLSLILEPTTLKCNHSFCYFCLSQLLENQYTKKSILDTTFKQTFYEFNCPLCRKPHKVEIVDLEKLINKEMKEKILLKFEKEYYEREKEHLEELKELEKRKIHRGIIYVGNFHASITSNSSNKHKWVYFVRLNGFEEQIIEKIIVNLHETFSPPIVTLVKEPFEIERIGWGTFTIRSEIHFKSKFKKAPLKVNHYLCFEGDGDFQEIEIDLLEQL